MLFPQSVAGSQIALEIVVEGETYRTALACASLKEGNNYIFPVTIKKTGLSVGETEITAWSEVEGNSAEATM